jgi:DNA-binding MarR family transcriptional regulator
MDDQEIAEQLRLDHLICFATYSASHAFSRFYRPTLDRLGLTYPQFVVMMVLWEHKKTTMKALSDDVQLESNTLTPLLKKLEAAGLVRRTRNTEDERVLDVEVTDKGMALKMDAKVMALELAKASGETLEGVLDLQQRLVKMRRSIEKATAS